MKAILKLLFLVACVGILAGCEKDELIPDQDDPILKKAVKVMVQPCPSTDVLTKAETDWQNINEALQNAQPNDVVQLGQGTFYLHKSIICENFDGTLKGSGINETVIQTAPDELFDVSECPPLNFTFEQKDGYTMFCFPYQFNQEKRTVVISDMKIIVNEPTAPYYRNLHTGTPLEANTLQAITIMNENLDNDLDMQIDLNVRCSNINITGVVDAKYLNDNNYSLYAGVVVLGSSNGKFVAQNLNIENSFYGIISNFLNGKDANASLLNCTIWNNNNGLIANLIHSCNIFDCDFGNSSAAPIYMNKYFNQPDANLPKGHSLIKHNMIKVSGGVGMYPIGMENVRLINNVFYGSGYTGLFTRGGDNWNVINNNFCDLSSFSGNTMVLNSPFNFLVKNNSNQIVGGTLPFDPSVIIDESRECED